MSEAGIDPELALQAHFVGKAAPRLDAPGLGNHLAEATAQLAALDGHMLAAAQANSLDSRMHHTAAAVMAAEAAQGAVAQVTQSLGLATAQVQTVERGLRRALGEAMHGTGTLQFATEHHSIDATASAGAVEITSPNLLPARFWRNPEPQPDKRAIAAALKLGPVPGARIAPAVPGIRIAARKS